MSADLQKLNAIAAAFSNLPYENITKILKHTGCSDSGSKLRRMEEVLEDHLKWNTGGTCFSLCNALMEILLLNGFEAFIAMGDMHYGKNIHCAVVVRFLQQSYLIDPGYLLHFLIRLPNQNEDVIVRTARNVVIVKGVGEGEVELYTEESGQRKWRYRLRVWPVSQAEFEEHWVHSFSLNSMESILLSRVTETGRVYFRKNRLEHVSAGSRAKQIVSPDEADLLSSMFGVPADLVIRAHHSLNGRR